MNHTKQFCSEKTKMKTKQKLKIYFFLCNSTAALLKYHRHYRHYYHALVANEYIIQWFSLLFFFFFWRINEWGSNWSLRWKGILLYVSHVLSMFRMLAYFKAADNIFIYHYCKYTSSLLCERWMCNVLIIFRKRLPTGWNKLAWVGEREILNVLHHLFYSAFRC